MDRQQALHAAINGHKIRHWQYQKGCYDYWDKDKLQLMFCAGLKHDSISSKLVFKGGYEIKREEKIIIGYVNIYNSHAPILFGSKEQADSVASKFQRIACKELEIKYYEGEGL